MDRNKIINKFNLIKNMGFIKSNRLNNTGIGKTFEDYLGVDENNDKLPDFAGFEVKTKRALTSSYLTLFTKSPTGPKGANALLRDQFGQEYEEFPGLRKIHTSIFSKYNTYLNRYGFKIVNDSNKKLVTLIIKNLEGNVVVNNQVYWSYNELENALLKKLKGLFYVNADTKIENGLELFHYNSAVIYINPSLNNLLNLIDKNKLMIDIRIGSYKSGTNYGKTHDHGTGFRIKPKDLSLLYDDVINIEDNTLFRD